MKEERTSAQISMCKRNNVEMALNIAGKLRQILGVWELLESILS